MMERLWHALGAPYRFIVALVNFTPQQMKSLLLVALLGGIMVYSMMSLYLLNRAEDALGKGEAYALQFNLIKTQLQNNFYLTAWFALIIGAVAFGADWIRAKYGDAEIGLGRGEDG